MTSPTPAPRQYSQQAVQTTISNTTLTISGTTLVVASNTGYPTVYPFTLRINPGTATEEIVDVASGLGTVSTPWVLKVDSTTGARSVDGTVARQWEIGTPIAHGFTARDFREVQNVVVAAQSLVNSAVPVGSCVLWYGQYSAIPTGWAPCDGRSWNTTTGAQATDGTAGSVKTPDLRDVFVMGAGGSYSPGNSGGNSSGTVTLTAANMPAVNHQHNDTYAITNNGAHTHTLRSRAAGAVNGTGAFSTPTTAGGTTTDDYVTSSGAHTHTISGSSLSVTTGNANPSPINITPPFKAFIWMMKVRNG